MVRTDYNKIAYPKGLSAADRRHCRKMITAVSSHLSPYNVIACSGGIDSTVLVHTVGQALRINPIHEYYKIPTSATAVYVDHGLRSHKETKQDAEHVKNIAEAYLGNSVNEIKLNIEKGSGVQERARDARYKALSDFCLSFYSTKGHLISVHLLMGHNANDNTETMLFSFLKGKMHMIPAFRPINSGINLFRPFLEFTRVDIERYARCFNLTWCEDSSNIKDDYTRNKIRHHLVPWIEQNINPNIVKTLGRKSSLIKNAPFD